MDFRSGGGDINKIQALAHELVGLQPDIIVISGTPVAPAVQRETRGDTACTAPTGSCGTGGDRRARADEVIPANDGHAYSIAKKVAFSGQVETWEPKGTSR
jgi:hypothetical protein